MGFSFLLNILCYQKRNFLVLLDLLVLHRCQTIMSMYHINYIEYVYPLTSMLATIYHVLYLNVPG